MGVGSPRHCLREPWLVDAGSTSSDRQYFYWLMLVCLLMLCASIYTDGVVHDALHDGIRVYIGSELPVPVRLSMLSTKGRRCAVSAPLERF